MEWVSKLHGQTVGLDSAPVIFYIEQHQDYIDLVRPFFASLAKGQFRAVTSTVTLLEVLVHPLRHGDEALAHRYNNILLSSPHILTLPVTFATAQEAADLRARYNLKTPDAIQLAVAIGSGATTFLTNDRDFPDDCGIKILKLRDLVA
jgi:predicted nucleic acid-binding protein